MNKYSSWVVVSALILMAVLVGVWITKESLFLLCALVILAMQPSEPEDAEVEDTDDGFGVQGITVQKRGDEYHACLTNAPEYWGCGKTRAESIGDLCDNHANKIGLEIQHV